MALTLYAALILLAVYVTWYLISLLQDPLRSIPGPLLARFSKLWCFWRFSRGQWNWESLELHRKYGKIVRIAPGHYSIGDVAAIKPIHGHGIGFNKSTFYDTWAPPGKTSMFKEQDNHYHGQLRKRFASMYSMTSVYAYEQGITECVELLCRRLVERDGNEVDLAWWLECFAFDSIGIVTYGERFGLLDNGKDENKLSDSVYGAFTYGSFMGFFPDMHVPFITASRAISRLTNWRGTGKMYLDSFTSQTTAQRRKDRADNPTIAAGGDNFATSILDKFLDANEKDPAYFTDDHITMGLGANVTAGSDTTSTTIAWAIYFLLRDPQVLTKVRKEISDAQSNGDGQISFRAVQNMPYLNAVLDETLRLFPQTGFGLPRVVPPGGAEICGHHFPAGSVVSMNAYAMHYDPQNFKDPEVFRPERWLEAGPQEKEAMNACYFPFGLGSRTCIGKNIAELVMLKALPQLVQRFDFELVEDLNEHGLPTNDIFLVRATSCRVVVRQRQAI